MQQSALRIIGTSLDRVFCLLLSAITIFSNPLDELESDRQIPAYCPRHQKPALHFLKQKALRSWEHSFVPSGIIYQRVYRI